MLRENWRWLAAYTACAVATVALLADLSSPAMWVLCSVVAAVVAGVVVVTGRADVKAIRTRVKAEASDPWTVQLHIINDAGLKMYSYQPISVNGEESARKQAGELAACNRWGSPDHWPMVTCRPTEADVVVPQQERRHD